jgi:hypothetical protein
LFLNVPVLVFLEQGAPDSLKIRIFVRRKRVLRPNEGDQVVRWSEEYVVGISKKHSASFLSKD